MAVLTVDKGITLHKNVLCDKGKLLHKTLYVLPTLAFILISSRGFKEVHCFTQKYSFSLVKEENCFAQAKVTKVIVRIMDSWFFHELSVASIKILTSVIWCWRKSLITYVFICIITNTMYILNPNPEKVSTFNTYQRIIKTFLYIICLT